MKWYQTGLTVEKQDIPDWKKPGVIDDINREICQRNLNRELKDINNEWSTTYQQVLEMVEQIPENDMFVPGKLEWTGKDTSAQYIVVKPSGHYAEHLTAL